MDQKTGQNPRRVKSTASFIKIFNLDYFYLWISVVKNFGDIPLCTFPEFK